MDTYAKDVAELGELETFDARAFVADEKTSQNVCDFVLALALFYDDFRDIVSAQRFIGRMIPEDRKTPTKLLGHSAGQQSHLFRITAAMLHELVKLFDNNAEAVNSATLAAVVKSLNPLARECWSSVLAAAQKSPKSDPLAKLLVFARHKVAFHYDAGEIARGYRKAFLEGSARAPFISRGDKMVQVRFYFADAAAESYMRSLGEEDVVEQLYSGATPLLVELNHALRELVTAFINTRGFGWRVHRPAG